MGEKERKNLLTGTNKNSEFRAGGTHNEESLSSEKLRLNREGIGISKNCLMDVNATLPMIRGREMFFFVY